MFQARKLMSAQRWGKGQSGQHIELGIAENNLFLMLAAMGLSHSIFGERLLPIGTLYDPFIARGLDALNYACYQDARFILVATPSGITLAPEGGAHQSIGTPLIGMAQDGIASFEPSYVDELAVILEWALEYIQRAPKAEKGDAWLHERDGGSVYLRLSTRTIDQVLRPMSPELRDGIIQGGYWMRPPAEGANLAVAFTGAVAPEAATAMGELLRHFPGAGLLAVTSADRLNAGWKAAQTAQQHGHDEASHIEHLLAPLARDAPASSRCWTAIQPRCRGWAACMATACRRWASSISARPAPSRTSIANTASMRRRSSKRRQWVCAGSKRPMQRPGCFAARLAC